MGDGEDLDGGFETKGEKSEVQGDLQIPSSLVALAPLSLSLLLFLSSSRSLFSTFSRESHRETYTKYTTHTYRRVHTSARVFVRHCDVIASDEKEKERQRKKRKRFAAFPPSRVLKESRGPLYAYR